MVALTAFIRGGIVLRFSEKTALGSGNRLGAHGIARKPARRLSTQYGILLYGRGWRKPTTKAPAIRWRNQECFAGSPLFRGDRRQREAIGRARTEKMKTAPCR